MYECTNPKDQIKMDDGVNRKDIDDNSMVHYAYLQDSPEIREILKANGFLTNREEIPRNIRAKKPRELRHEKKVEDSDDDDFLDKVSALHERDADLSSSDDENERLAKIRGGDINQVHENYVLATTSKLNKKQKLAFAKDPDYCFVTTKEMVGILKVEIDSLLRDNGVYYSIFEKKVPDEQGTCIMVLYFDDNLIDLFAEINHVKARLKSQPILTEFRCYASDFFETFNSRQVQSLMLDSINCHMDVGYMEKEHVISDHFPCHTPIREELDHSWHSHKYALVWGFLVGGF